MTAARAIRDRHAGKAPAPPVSLRLNVVVTDIPFDDDVILGHIDTSRGLLVIEDGHLDDPDVLVTMEWALARAVLIERDVAMLGQAFLQRRILVEGDLTKLFSLQSLMGPGGTQVPTEVVSTATRVADELSAITAD